MTRPLRLFYPLDRFYARRGLPLPAFEQIDGHTMPEPYRRLLVGQHDMTPTLEAFYGESARLHVIERFREGDALKRLVTLRIDSRPDPIEFGAIVIHLPFFPPEARERILECCTPLGTILGMYCVQHASRPQAFLQIRSDALMNEMLHLNGETTLYGRRNVLLTPENRILADIVEILPPYEG